MSEKRITIPYADWIQIGARLSPSARQVENPNELKYQDVIFVSTPEEFDYGERQQAVKWFTSMPLSDETKRKIREAFLTASDSPATTPN